MSAGGDEEENEFSRREGLVGLAALLTAGGATIWGVKEIYEDLLSYGDHHHGRYGHREDHHHHDDITYHRGDDYDGHDDGTTFTPTPDHDPIDSWNEALPGQCSLSTDERHWLVSRVDMYDTLDGEDFFEYVGEEVRLYDQDTELRMEVDEDYSGGEFEPDRGYNIPDAC